jgi:hypothetical protein
MLSRLPSEPLIMLKLRRSKVLQAGDLVYLAAEQPISFKGTHIFDDGSVKVVKVKSAFSSQTYHLSFAGSKEEVISSFRKMVDLIEARQFVIHVLFGKTVGQILVGFTPGQWAKAIVWGVMTQQAELVLTKVS